ncbi:Modification methylase DpnIIA [Luteitalea pratensis]|uniref:Site-specific DNA-methyltransferase (adenine-specific) n=1 Tax=Luteitalea pratensis TaxID=1855912 RepID=A0A143PVQ6_LUTPR|nr:Dam family site-specific DNA-(adenine-N6)-methyltransferase [Luteitalea pratensis]AMY12837.1 Modification methylase DpnIIA [Luteitalea pratensis]
MPADAKTLEPQTAPQPPLKWAGGKRWQVPYLEPLWALHTRRRLVEPFCGGLAVTLGLQPGSALLNDVNPHVISFYRWLKKGLKIGTRLENNEALYYQHRERFNELLRNGGGESEEAAGLFYFLNRTGYNGLCRFNRSGEFNVPFGSYKTINYTRDFSPYRAAFAAWDFTTGDFEKIEFGSGDFVYADPPYDVDFTHYSQGGFSWEDQVRTATRLARHRGPVVLVNQATPRIVELYHELGYQLDYLNAPRRISCTGDRSPAREVLAKRNL